MTNNRDLSQKIKELKTKLSDTLEEIEALEIEQSLIQNERLIDLDEKVKEIVERMKTRFKMYDQSNDIIVKASLFDRVIEIVSKCHKIAFLHLSIRRSQSRRNREMGCRTDRECSVLSEDQFFF